MLAGMLAGAVTGFLHTVFEIPAILAGILTQIALWSVNLRIMGKSNTPLLQHDTIFSRMTEATGLSINAGVHHRGPYCGGPHHRPAVLVLRHRDRQRPARHRQQRGHDPRAWRVHRQDQDDRPHALQRAGGPLWSLICQSQKYADIGMGTGAIVIGLAAIVIGEVLGRLTPGKLTGFKSRLVSAVAGSVVYFLIRAIVLQMGMDANDMKLLSAIIVALALCVPVVWERFKLRASYSKGGEADA